MAKIYTARGMNTKKIYVMGNDKQSLLKRLQKMYPQAKIPSKGSQTAMNIYPEPPEVVCQRG